MADKEDKTTSNFTGDYNLFNNPMVNSARQGMSTEILERYEAWGHAVFDDIDYETGTLTEVFPAPMLDALSYIEESIKSGQHISSLTKDEKNLLSEMVGKEWYKKYGYIEEDLDDIVTLKKE